MDNLKQTIHDLYRLSSSLNLYLSLGDDFDKNLCENELKKIMALCDKAIIEIMNKN